MINLIKGEFYKLFKGKAFWGVLGFMCFYAVLEPILFKKIMLQQGLNEAYNNISSMLAVLQEEGIYTVIGILAAIFVVGEFTSGSMKQIASRGFSRTQLFLSKYITLFLGNILIVVVTLIIRFIIGALIFGVGADVFNYDYLRLFYIFISECVVIAGFTSIYCFIAYGLCSMAGAVTANALFVSIGRLVFMIIGMLINKAELFQNIWLTGMAASIADYEQFTFKQELIYGLVFLLVAKCFMIITLTIFRKRDI